MITSIFCENNLNLFGSTSEDGFINLYTLPKFNIFKSIKLNSYIFADYLFISIAPLPCFSFFCGETKTFYNYSINGQKLSEIKEDSADFIYYPIIYKNETFCDNIVKKFFLF